MIGRLARGLLLRLGRRRRSRLPPPAASAVAVRRPGRPARRLGRGQQAGEHLTVGRRLGRWRRRPAVIDLATSSNEGMPSTRTPLRAHSSMARLTEDMRACGVDVQRLQDGRAAQQARLVLEDDLQLALAQPAGQQHEGLVARWPGCRGSSPAARSGRAADPLGEELQHLRAAAARPAAGARTLSGSPPGAGLGGGAHRRRRRRTTAGRRRSAARPAAAGAMPLAAMAFMRRRAASSFCTAAGSRPTGSWAERAQGRRRGRLRSGFAHAGSAAPAGSAARRTPRWCWIRRRSAAPGRRWPPPAG